MYCGILLLKVSRQTWPIFRQMHTQTTQDPGYIVVGGDGQVLTGIRG